MKQLRAVRRLLPAAQWPRALPPLLSPSSSRLGTTRGARIPSSTARTHGICLSQRHFGTSPVRLAASDTGKAVVEMGRFPPERIRNLSIIAHIDHGKSTLADRLLQMTNTVPAESSPQFLDKLKVERDRGITVKAQTVSIIHKHTDGKEYLINLIDTPGHVDFSYEVSRSLGACEGGLLLVDCTQGIQAQTLSVFHHALEADLKLLAVINKVDLPHASPEETSVQIESSLGIPLEDHMPISAKSGLGVGKVLDSIIDRLPAPQWEGDNKLRALVFDTFYDRYRGVVSLVRIMSGTLKRGDKVRFLQAGKKYDILDIGFNNPEEVAVDALREGQVGFLVCNMKNSEEAFIGDTVCLLSDPVEPLPGFQETKAMVYAGVFPVDSSEFPQLEESIGRLTLTDRSVSIERESSNALGQGFRLGFLGTLHMDVFRQRLEDEYSSEVIITAPTVPFKVVYNNGKEVHFSNPAEFPDVSDTKNKVVRVEEPMVNATIFVPTEYIGAMMELCAKYRGVQEEYRHLDNTDRAILRYRLPLSEIVTDFFSELKSSSSGFASFDYEEAGYEKSDLVKLNILLNGKPVDALAQVVHRSFAQSIGRVWVKKLKDVLPRQLFELSIQAAIGSKVVARESLSAMRKDVTAGLYGGHYERKLKHLNKQKEGKKRLKSLTGNIRVPQSAFYDVLSSRPRSYSTQASHLDFEEHLPPIPPTDLVLPPLRTPTPLPKHVICPEQRSRLLSNLHLQISIPEFTSDSLFAHFTKLYLASPPMTFSPMELHAIAKAMYSIDQRHKLHVRQSQERFDTVVNALRDTVGHDNRGGLRGLELAILVTNARHARLVTLQQLRTVGRLFTRLYPEVPKGPEGRKMYAMAINHMLYLCALAGSPTALNLWWGKMINEGIQPDSYSYLTRMLIYGGLQNTTAVIAELERALTKVDNKEHRRVLVNATIWMAARAGDWPVVSTLYAGLMDSPTASSELEEAGLNPNWGPMLAELGTSRITYAMLTSAYAFVGDLIAALNILRQMLADSHVPGIHEYATLFKGFGRFGVIPAGPSGPAASVFPMWIDPRAVRPEGALNNPWGEESESESEVDGDGESGQFTSNYPPSPASVWTQAALQDLFTSFLALPPPQKDGQSWAPTSKVIYHTLLAFSRVTNGALEIVLGALEAMTRKFGPENEEGWVGWDEDRRLQRVRGELESLTEAPEEELY